MKRQIATEENTKLTEGLIYRKKFYRISNHLYDRYDRPYRYTEHRSYGTHIYRESGSRASRGIMATYKAQVLDAFHWWNKELLTVWANLALKAKHPKPSDFTNVISNDGIRVHADGDPEFQSPPLDAYAISEEIAALLRLGRRRPSIAIRIDSGLILKRHLSLQRLPARQARAMAELDLMASTPIDPKQAHIVFTDDSVRGCSYHVVKAKTLAAVLEAIRTAGGTVRSIAIVEDDQKRPIDRLSLEAIWPPTKRERLVRRAWVTAGATLLLGLAGTFAHTQWRYWQAEAVLDEQIADAQIEAKKARTILQKRQTELEQTDRIRAEKKNAISTVRILAELTRLLPDSAWATDLSLKNNELTLTGFAGSAADLIQPIEASPLFSAPEFASPVVKVPGQTGERFTITARIDPQ